MKRFICAVVIISNAVYIFPGWSKSHLLV